VTGVQPSRSVASTPGPLTQLLRPEPALVDDLAVLQQQQIEARGSRIGTDDAKHALILIEQKPA